MTFGLAAQRPFKHLLRRRTRFHNPFVMGVGSMVSSALSIILSLAFLGCMFILRRLWLRHSPQWERLKATQITSVMWLAHMRLDAFLLGPIVLADLSSVLCKAVDINLTLPTSPLVFRSWLKTSLLLSLPSPH